MTADTPWFPLPEAYRLPDSLRQRSVFVDAHTGGVTALRDASAAADDDVEDRPASGDLTRVMGEALLLGSPEAIDAAAITLAALLHGGDVTFWDRMSADQQEAHRVWVRQVLSAALTRTIPA